MQRFRSSRGFVLTEKINNDTVIEHRACMEKHQRDGTTEPANTAAGANKPIKFNICRFANVITGTVMAPILQHERGKALTKDEMQEKLSQDQLIWERFTDEYIDAINPSYNCHAHSSVERKLNSAEFERIPRERWKEAQNFFKDSGRILERNL